MKNSREREREVKVGALTVAKYTYVCEAVMSLSLEILIVMEERAVLLCWGCLYVCVYIYIHI